MSDRELRSKIIRLAHSKPELREHLLPLVTKTGGKSSDTVEDFIMDEMRVLTLVVNDQKLWKFLRKLSKYLVREIGGKYDLGRGEISADDGNELVTASILDVDLAIKVNRATKMIDFDVKNNAFTIESEYWSNTSIKGIIRAIEEKMKDKLEEHYFRNRS